MKHRPRLLALLLSAALSVGLSPPAVAYGPEYRVDTTIYSELHSGQETQVAKGFAIASRVFRGDQSGALNWDGTLTRVEAATMIVRLMGLDGEAQAAQAAPSPFSDVPRWANGYINVAYKNGVAKGVGGDLVDPHGVCGVREFLTMLYRLTHLTEGTDFSWATAVSDFLEDMRAIDDHWRWERGMTAARAAEAMETYYAQNGPFTREAAADVMYFMLNIVAGPDGESLGDILAMERGMSDILLFNHSVYRTAYGMSGGASVTLENFSSPKTPTLLSVQSGKLRVEGADREKIFVTLFPDREQMGTDAEGYTGDQTIPLPEEDVTVSVLYQQIYDEKGDLLSVGIGHSETLRVFYKDGSWSLGSWSEAARSDCGYLYAYQSQEHWQALADQEAELAAAFTPPAEIKALADKLTAGKKTELEKADAICQWVATHIYYNNPAANSSDLEMRFHESDTEVYESRLAVCEGYSNLTISLMRAAGLKCYNESGRANNGLHGWNVAYLDGKWVVIDNTWDSPLEYEKTTGSGYQCRYDDPDLIWEWRTPKDIREPNASRRSEKVHFNMDHDSFYTSHRLLRDPTLGSRSVLNVKDVLP